MRKKRNLRTIRYGLCVLASLACSLIFGGELSRAANKNYEKDFLKTYDFVAKATPTAKPGTWEQVNDPQGSGTVTSDGIKYYQSARYRFTDGTYANNQWLYAYGEHGAGPYWYFIGPDGYMVTGWLKWYYNWYYFDDLGALVTGWFEADGNWYYANEKGHMLRDTYVDGYYINKSGIRVDTEQPTEQSIEQPSEQSIEQPSEQLTEQSASDTTY